MATQVVEIRKAVTLNKNSVERPDGYDVFIRGEWDERFRLLRDAKRYAAQVCA